MIPPPLAWQAHVPATRVWALVVALRLRAFCHPHRSCPSALAAFLRRQAMAVAEPLVVAVAGRQLRPGRLRPEPLQELLHSVVPPVRAPRTTRMMPLAQTMRMELQARADWNRTTCLRCCFVRTRKRRPQVRLARESTVRPPATLNSRSPLQPDWQLPLAPRWLFV